MPFDPKFFAVSMTPNRTTKNSKSETKYRYRDYGTLDERRVSNITDYNIQSNNKINKCPLKLNLRKIEENNKKKKIPFGRLGKALVTLF
jgi:hypothetical protein